MAHCRPSTPRERHPHLRRGGREVIGVVSEQVAEGSPLDALRLVAGVVFLIFGVLFVSAIGGLLQVLPSVEGGPEALVENTELDAVTGVMPALGERLDDMQIRLLVAWLTWARSG